MIKVCVGDIHGFIIIYAERFATIDNILEAYSTIFDLPKCEPAVVDVLANGEVLCDEDFQKTVDDIFGKEYCDMLEDDGLFDDTGLYLLIRHEGSNEQPGLSMVAGIKECK